MADPQPQDPVVLDVEVRWARRVAAVATAWMFIVVVWEMFGPILAGHYASMASMGIIAENMLTHGIAGPVWEYTVGAPSPRQYYCHHPWGIFWTTTGVFAVFGRHDFVCRLPAAVLSVATPPLLYALSKAIWRPAAGAASALAFVSIPLALSFAQFNALEVPVIAWSLLACWGFVRLTQTERRRYLAISTVGAFMALNADWPAFVLVGTLLAFGLLRGFVLGHRWFGPSNFRIYAQWWALWATTAVLIFVGYLAVFQSSGNLGELLQAYVGRSSGRPAPLAEILASRHYWLSLSFTGVGLVLGQLALWTCCLRLLTLKREHEVVPLAFFVMAAVQYVVFRQGADVHVFWPHYFAAFIALGMGAIVCTAIPIIGRLARLVPLIGRLNVALFTLGLAALPLLIMLRDGVEVLAYARRTGGRFNEKGVFIQSDGPKTAFLRWLEPQLPRDRIIDMHQSMFTTWGQVWSLGGRVVSAQRKAPTGPADDTRDIYLLDTRFSPDSTQNQLADRFALTVVDSFWMLDRRKPHALISAYRFVETEPDVWHWLFMSATEPQRVVVADPFGTWELREHFGQPADVPEAEPSDAHEQRIAYNIAVSSGDLNAQAKHLEQLREGTTGRDIAFRDGTTLLATRFEEGVQPTLTIYLRVAGPSAGAVSLKVHGTMTRGPAVSTSMRDPVRREVGPPHPISSTRWRPGYIYAFEVPILARPGVERFEAELRTRAGEIVWTADGSARHVEVLTY